MLTMAETRETTKHLSVNQLREWAGVCKNLRFYYKHGKWKKGTDPKSDYCTLCEFAEQNEGDSGFSTCDFCVWKMLEGLICVPWFRRIYPHFQGELRSISWARLIREPKFIAIRIQMLDKWVRRLNALAANRKRSTTVLTKPKGEPK